MKRLFAPLLALFAFAGPSLAQGDLAPSPTFLGPALLSNDVAGAPRVGAQLVRALESPSPTTRAEALHTIATLAFAGADLRPATPALLSVFKTDPDSRHRVLAIRSLEVTADEDVMAALRSEAGEQEDPAVQRLLFAVLVDHYGVDALRSDAGVATLVRSLRDDFRL